MNLLTDPEPFAIDSLCGLFVEIVGDECLTMTTNDRAVIIKQLEGLLDELKKKNGG